MKCPTCFSTMRCISEIHKIPSQPGRERMDLHCYNRDNAREPNRCTAICHMGVITEDPKVWECHDYNFSLTHDGKLYVLSGQNYSVDYFHQGVRHPLTRLRDAHIYLPSVGYAGDDIVLLPYFIPISTGDDMHEKAWELFHRLRNLAVFS